MVLMIAPPGYPKHKHRHRWGAWQYSTRRLRRVRVCNGNLCADYIQQQKKNRDGKWVRVS